MPCLLSQNSYNHPENVPSSKFMYSYIRENLLLASLTFLYVGCKIALVSRDEKICLDYWKSVRIYTRYIYIRHMEKEHLSCQGFELLSSLDPCIATMTVRSLNKTLIHIFMDKFIEIYKVYNQNLYISAKMLYDSIKIKLNFWIIPLMFICPSSAVSYFG